MADISFTKVIIDSYFEAYHTYNLLRSNTLYYLLPKNFIKTLALDH